MKKRTGFTLIELMVVVAILGVLVSIAQPNMMEMQYRSKRAELPSNVHAIMLAQKAYEAAEDTFMDIPDFVPSDDLGKGQNQWEKGTDFDQLGWEPDGWVRGKYKTDKVSNYEASVTAMSDVDGNGDQAIYVLNFDARDTQASTSGWQTPMNYY